MGFQLRRRTKGKNSWLNFSGSGVSISTKIGNVTTNVGPRGVRATVNLGHGVRYVKSKSLNKTNVVGSFIQGMFTIAFVIFIVTLIMR